MQARLVLALLAGTWCGQEGMCFNVHTPHTKARRNIPEEFMTLGKSNARLFVVLELKRPLTSTPRGCLPANLAPLKKDRCELDCSHAVNLCRHSLK